MTKFKVGDIVDWRYGHGVITKVYEPDTGFVPYYDIKILSSPYDSLNANQITMNEDSLTLHKEKEMEKEDREYYGVWSNKLERFVNWEHCHSLENAKEEIKRYIEEELDCCEEDDLEILKVCGRYKVKKTAYEIEEINVDAD